MERVASNARTRSLHLISLQRLSTFCSIVFRYLSYVYLRWIPSGHIGVTILPPLFIIYVTSWAFSYGLDENSDTQNGEIAVAKSETSISNGNSAIIQDQKVAKSETIVSNGNSAIIQDETVIKSETIASNGNSAITQDETLVTVKKRHTSSTWKLLNLAINLILAAFVLDLTLRNNYFNDSKNLAFHRVSAITHNSAKVTIRNPSSNSIQIRFRELGEVAYHRGPTLHFTNATDYVSVAKLQYLDPSTEYEYVLEYLNKTEYKAPGPESFKTFPDPGTSSRRRLSFAATSCIKPGFPYDGPFADPLRIKGFDKLSQHADDLDFLLFLGDFIYADVPLMMGSDAETYRRQYRQTWASKSLQRASAILPMIFAYDDHEIKNNWASEQRDPYDAAISSSWDLYAGAGNYDNAKKSYFSFVYGDIASFFVMDTRKYRDNATVEPPRTMLGAQQKSDLFRWLLRNDGVYKFIVTSVPFTKGWKGVDGDKDTWGGYLQERDEILSFIEEKRVQNVVFLSGDRHEFAAVQFRSNIVEFSTSPLNMFYLPTIPFRSFYLKDTDEDKQIKYIPHGQIKWGRFDIDVSDRDHPTLDFVLMVDGKEAWTYTHHGTKQTHRNAMSSLIDGTLLDRFNMRSFLGY